MLTVNYLLNEIKTITGGSWHQKSDVESAVNNILIDSRQLVNPGQSIFVAMKSKKNDGHNYVTELYKKGVRSFLLDRIPPGTENLQEASIILVRNTLIALQKLAEHHRKKFNIPVIGITGSNGKTIVKEWLYQLMHNDYNIVRSPKSYNSQIGVPLSVLQMHKDHDLAIFEAGISEPGEMDRLVKVIRPTTGVFTNIGQAHNENFMNTRQKVGEKLKLFTSVDTLIYCSDHNLIREQIIKSELSLKIKTYSWTRNNDSELRVKTVEKHSADTTITALFREKERSVTIPFTDDASIENAMHCWMVMLLLGYPQETITERMKNLTPVAMRLELKEGINHCSIINDSYNSDINSLSIALDFMNQQKQHRKKTVILSDILQTGLNNYSLYQAVYEMLKDKKVDQLVGIGPDISRQSSLFADMNAVFFKDTDEFLNRYSLAGLNNETILLKGARIFEFERINKLLQQQTHTTVMEINLNALVENFNYFRSQLNTSTKIMAMVKAFSYGSGSFEIANILQYHRADYLGVAYADEGVELRKAGISLPLMVMNPEEHSFDSMIRHNLEPEIYSFRVLDMLEKAIDRNMVRNNNPVGIHIKLDTGMRRLGFATDELEKLISRVKNNPLITIKSVFSHLAASDKPGQENFTREQIGNFSKMSAQITENFSYQIIRHIANSAAITRFPESRFDMVRLGIGMYGIATDPKIKSKLSNVSRLTTCISQIKKIRKGDTVGYGRSFTAEEDMTIATIPIGYADGLSRILSNGRGKLWVNGKPAAIAGNVCMDMCMINITGMDVNEGDEVVVFDEQHNIEEMAKDLNTIPYEVLTNVSRRVKRVYFHE